MSASYALSYQITGPERAPLLVFLHGFLGDKCEWNAIASSLANEVRCMTVDLPGHGESQVPAGPWGFVETATAIVSAIDEADAASFSLLGYSMGGRIALYLASIYAMRIDKLILESASPGLRTQAEREARRAQDEELAQRLETHGLEPFLRDWYAQPLFASLHRTPGRVESLIARRAQGDPIQLALALRNLGTGNMPSLWSDWQNNHVPTHLIAGALDRKYTVLAGDMANQCSCARFDEVPGVGHNVHLEAPADYTQLVRGFISGR
ncbi:MAG: 2-succinyl-6-hydroxy-2,4-cyclohexadiene-1-carboxylate synthase [Candidatus Hydrogenedentes bacterium]|nr:2-succinyl-6-hydroxy-2,4-cyclohexadiene-1-carboxylate synthase [Candidatus Hydrogenedentota bacterium]